MSHQKLYHGRYQDDDEGYSLWILEISAMCVSWRPMATGFYCWEKLQHNTTLWTPSLGHQCPVQCYIVVTIIRTLDNATLWSLSLGHQCQVQYYSVITIIRPSVSSTILLCGHHIKDISVQYNDTLWRPLLGHQCLVQDYSVLTTIRTSVSNTISVCYDHH